MWKLKLYYDSTYTPEAESVEQIIALLKELESREDYEIDLIDTEGYSDQDRFEIFEKVFNISSQRRVNIRKIFGKQGFMIGKIPALFVYRNDELYELRPFIKEVRYDIETYLRVRRGTKFGVRTGN